MSKPRLTEYEVGVNHSATESGKMKESMTVMIMIMTKKKSKKKKKGRKNSVTMKKMSVSKYTVISSNESFMLIKPKNSSGYDEITRKIIKSCASLISIPLSYIYNYSLHTGIFPDRLKMAVVKPLTRRETNFKFQIVGPFHYYQRLLKYLRKQCTVG